jgi:import receptor subunit TOM20
MEEQYRQLPGMDTKDVAGLALYKISTYIGQSMENPNVKIIFAENNNKLSVVATQDIQKGEELITDYVVPL